MGEPVRSDVRRKLELWADPSPPVELRENWPVDGAGQVIPEPPSTLARFVKSTIAATARWAAGAVKPRPEPA